MSVIIPTFNRAGSIRRSVASALEQLEDLEVVIVDDGSSDDTEDVIRSIGDQRIRFVRQENAGSSAARVRGVSESLGQFLLFLDSDDYLLAGMISTLLQLLRNAPSAQFAFCEAWFEEEDTGNRSPAVQLPLGTGTAIAKFITIYSQCYNCRFLIRRSAYEASGGYLANVGVGAPELAVFVPLFCRFPFKRTRERLAVIRLGGQDHLSRRPEQAFNGVTTLLSSLMEKRDVRTIIGPIIREARANHLMRYADNLYARNRFCEALTRYLGAALEYPALAFKTRSNPVIYAGKSIVRGICGLRISEF